MKYYYVNRIKQSNGDHEVHASTCSYLPIIENREPLGYFNDCKEAVKKQKKNMLNLMDATFVQMLAIRNNQLS